MKLSGLTLVVCFIGNISSLLIKSTSLCAAFSYRKLHLLPVVCYALLMLFALWKQNSKTASSADSASHLDNAPSADSSNKLSADSTLSTGSSNKLPADGTPSTGYGNKPPSDGTPSAGGSNKLSADGTSSKGYGNKPPADGTSSTDSSNKLPVDGTSPASGMSSIISSACIAAGCLLLLAYSLLYMALGHSRMPLLIAGMLGISAGTLLNGLRLKNLHIRHHIIRLVIEAAIVAICWISVHGGPK